MNKVITIYDAKTNLSKLVKKAQAGEIIYIGAYGNPQAVIAPVPVRLPIKIGIWEHKKLPNAYKTSELVNTDSATNADFEKSLNQPLL